MGVGLFVLPVISIAMSNSSISFSFEVFIGSALKNFNCLLGGFV